MTSQVKGMNGGEKDDGMSGIKERMRTDGEEEMSRVRKRMRE